MHTYTVHTLNPTKIQSSYQSHQKKDEVLSYIYCTYIISVSMGLVGILASPSVFINSDKAKEKISESGASNGKWPCRRVSKRRNFFFLLSE